MTKQDSKTSSSTAPAHSLNGTRYGKLQAQVSKMLRERGAKTSSPNEARSHEEKKPRTKSAAKANYVKKAPIQPSTMSGNRKPAPAVEMETAYNNDRTVYVQGLPFTATEDQVRDFFAPCGEIVGLRLPRWHDSGNLKGYGHVEFKSSESAAAALEKNGEYLGNRFLVIESPMVPRALAETAKTGPVERPPGCRTVFIKNLPYDATEEQVRAQFMVYGPIVSIRLAVWNHTNNLKGFGYVDFKREDSAEIAVKKSGTLRLGDRPVIVDFETGAPKKSFKANAAPVKSKSGNSLTARAAR